MSVEDEKVLELQHRKEKIFYGGGAKAIEKQKAMGKLTARERIIALLDEGSTAGISVCRTNRFRVTA